MELYNGVKNMNSKLTSLSSRALPTAKTSNLSRFLVLLSFYQVLKAGIWERVPHCFTPLVVFRGGGFILGAVWLCIGVGLGGALAWLTPTRYHAGPDWLITRLVLGCLPQPGPKYCNHMLIVNANLQMYLTCYQVKY